MNEENGDSMRNCKEQTYGLVRFEKKKRIRRKEDRRKMITSFSMQANGCSYEDYKHANYGNGDGTPAEEISFTI